MVYSIRPDNAVTKLYMEIIENAFSLIGQQVTAVHSADDIDGTNGSDIYLTATVQNAVKLWLCGRRNIVIWIQGLWSEESYMRHHSRVRKGAIDAAERFILKRARFIFFVSAEMRRFYEDKYELDFSGRAYLMPCFNADIEKKYFFTPDKYKNNVFVYIGGMQIWQRFNDIVRLYGKVEAAGIPNAKLLVYTQQREEASSVLRAHSIKSWELDWVAPEKVQSALAEVKFGFAVRENIDVNRVATPTKIANYLASGVIPIYSDCLCGITDILSGTKYSVPLPDMESADPIMEMLKVRCAPDDVYKEYAGLFTKAYNSAEYTKDIGCKLCSAGFSGKQ
jgi:hypothetical protein